MGAGALGRLGLSLLTVICVARRGESPSNMELIWNNGVRSFYWTALESSNAGFSSGCPMTGQRVPAVSGSEAQGSAADGVSCIERIFGEHR